MFKIRPLILFFVNVLLMIASLVFYRLPRGDEYLILFLIPLIFVVAPFTLTLPQIIILFFANVAFFVFYHVIGVLNAIDVSVFAVLLGSIICGSYMLKGLYTSFEAHL